MKKVKEERFGSTVFFEAGFEPTLLIATTFPYHFGHS